MRCATGKNGYYSEEEVHEALIRSRIRFETSAVNYYLCHDCDEFHLTSQGEEHPLLKDPAIMKRIKEERRSQEWEGRLRR
jgi:hypothetical protein